MHEKLKSALKTLSITADHAMLQPTLLKVADIFANAGRKAALRQHINGGEHIGGNHRATVWKYEHEVRSRTPLVA